MPFEEELARVQTWIERLDELKNDLKPDDERLFLVQREIDRFVASEQDRERERKRADKKAAKSLEKEFGWITAWASKPQLPAVAQVFTRFTYRDINANLDPLLYRVEIHARGKKACPDEKGIETN